MTRTCGRHAGIRMLHQIFISVQTRCATSLHHGCHTSSLSLFADDHQLRDLPGTKFKLHRDLWAHVLPEGRRGTDELKSEEGSILPKMELRYNGLSTHIFGYP